MKAYITLDYELFMGSKVGTIDNSLIRLKRETANGKIVLFHFSNRHEEETRKNITTLFRMVKQGELQNVILTRRLNFPIILERNRMGNCQRILKDTLQGMVYVD